MLCFDYSSCVGTILLWSKLLPKCSKTVNKRLNVVNENSNEPVTKRCSLTLS